jgi:hypothetical protein
MGVVRKRGDPFDEPSVFHPTRAKKIAHVVEDEGLRTISIIMFLHSALALAMGSAWTVKNSTKPSASDVERRVAGELANIGIRLVSFRVTDGPKGQTQYTPSFWTRYTWYEGEMEFTNDCYWRTDVIGIAARRELPGQVTKL